MLFDAHTHLSPETFFQAYGYHQLAVASTPEECCFLETLSRQHPTVHFACGVHPWRSAEVSVDSLLPFLEKAVAIGEIGMDRVWCQVDLEVQRSVFRRQLDLARTLKKPIVLHTKGCEKEVLADIGDFPLPILVHWYSCERYVEDYLKKGCYFTIGPDIAENKAVSDLVRLVPLERLMVESDGVEGVSWAMGHRVSPQEIPAVLRRTVAEIGVIKGLDVKQVAKALFETGFRWVEGG